MFKGGIRFLLYGEGPGGKSWDAILVHQSLPSVGPWWKDRLHEWLRYPEGSSLFEGLGGKFEITRAGHREMEVKLKPEIV